MTTVRRSLCPLDCPDSCTLAVSVEGGRVVRVDAAREGALHPLQGGVICGKVRRMAEHVHGRERLTTPLLRTGPKGLAQFREVSFDQAMEHVATAYRRVASEHGPLGLLPVSYGGSNGHLTQDAADGLFFRRFGARRAERTLCAAPSSAAQDALYGKMPGMSLLDLEHSRLIVLWGINPHATSIHLVPIVQRARAAGAKLVVVDPRATPFARDADLHLALRPGTDLPVALAIVRELFARGRADREFLEAHTRGHGALIGAAEAWTLERAADVAEISADDLGQLAHWYGTIRPAAIRCGWGVERSRSGGMATAAILALPAVAGQFGQRGGGFAMSAGSAVWSGELQEACDEPEGDGPAVNLSQLGRALTPGAGIFAIHVYNANPLATFPHQELIRRGLEREDLFTVVHDAVLTDTARYADVVLPATTFLEHAELHRSYGAFALQYAEPAIAPVGESRSNHQVFTDLLQRLGLARPGERLDEARFLEHALARRPERLSALRRAGLVAPDMGFAPIAFRDVFPTTPDRRVDLDPLAFRDAPDGPWGFREDPAPGRLALISPAIARLTSSTFGQLLPGDVPLSMHPEDATRRGLRDGQVVTVFNEQGEVRVRLSLDPHLRPGVVSLPKGLWARHTHNGRTANALVPDHVADLGGGACYNDARVDVRP